jgi:hypothetical protein
MTDRETFFGSDNGDYRRQSTNALLAMPDVPAAPAFDRYWTIADCRISTRDASLRAAQRWHSLPRQLPILVAE